MYWDKLGLVFCANNHSEYMVSGGRTPVPLHIGDDLYRIFFASYDGEGRGRVFSLEIDLTEPTQPRSIGTAPLLDIGNVGFYDDNGIIPSSLVVEDDSLYLYTIGFSVKNKVIFDAATGLAISKDYGKSFVKLTGPVLDRGVDDPCFAASPCVLKTNEGWKMWYVSCEYWEKEGAGYKHYYNIKYKTSVDGIYWEPRGVTCIDFKNEFEYAISRPAVIITPEGKYRMWYSYRAQPEVDTYRIGYAESQDGVNWERKDELSGIDVSNEGWDSEMICYPCIFQHKGYTYMLYNGNGYGRSGFGIAVLREG
ncbi:hypothetical protein F0267_10020 [Vibrio coralliilyticus]|uniref:Glycosyl hydrolase family 32 N-terminal domain-containing protein n=1 Tax=Vibrio coralliilyticus TaxID=190893 RepID=A0AAN0VZ76_9VIBR|nr:hypothetical protein [Vibrio coralliilyticus]AIW20301.1 hypothetical protein IX92_15225 [Vibrio coralliilyticus]NOH38571.1 hypothetical protein [Vibrio coralliilyticus]